NDKPQQQLIQINNTPHPTEQQNQHPTNTLNPPLPQPIQNINNPHTTQQLNQSKTNTIPTINTLQPNLIKKPTPINTFTQQPNNQNTLIPNHPNPT
ncbi:DUF1542 domain-containing protein, partial [Staphylococcus epidermidis]|uniref:DUF1542 domain-containing protein n=1 Tax=Staphylococcus epidermidis TaxID=1282 RepID=UPI0011A9CC7F